jgi:Ca2+-binding RTX toxin-like protein
LGGSDTVRTSLSSYTLPSKIENLVFIGTGNFAGAANALDNTITGGAGDDTLSGNDGDDTLNGSIGNDVMQGGAGDDRLNGAAGADTMRGGTGNDGYLVDDSHDVVDETAGDGVDKVHSSVSFNMANTAGVLGDVEDLVLRGASNLIGNGNALGNAIAGNGGDNVLRGFAGNDSLRGMGGNDQLVGGAGADRLTGDDGADRFGFVGIADSTVAAAGRHTINDFSHAQGDKVDLSAMDAQSIVAGNQAFAFIGFAAFSHQAGELRIEAAGPNLLATGDVNGNGTADFAILLKGVATADASDFVL